MKIFVFVCLLLQSIHVHAQELFPSTEQASTLPKGVFAARFSFQTFQEPLGRSKYWTALRAMYGLSRKLTVIGTLSASNHHLKAFPGSLINYFMLHHKKQYPAFPYLLEGVHFYAKYRLLSFDGEQRHLRMALYAEGSKVFGAHDTAEPNLMGDNSGMAGGLILTWLHKRLAVSFTGGYIHPLRYKDSIVTFRSGNTWNYALSSGYRIYPRTYSSYENVNINVYAELLGRAYEAASITYRGQTFTNSRFLLAGDPYSYATLIRGNYIELRPALQFIFKSKTRVDLGASFPVYNKSYLYYYPLFFVNVQKYFFPKDKKRSTWKVKTAGS